MTFPIPPVMIWTLGAVGAIALARVLTREWRRVNAELRPCRATQSTEGPDRARLPRLRRDPVTGIYRPE
ncbi:MAG TPA: hypothetical protein VG985_00470 [Xanthobacteraceae bacterium]|nr:hypothetical protein [Xanthobacteraceae bacterium]